MSFSGVGGFQGGDALLAFAAIQQGRMNEEMTASMKLADLRSQMAGDLADLKSHLDTANKHPEVFVDVDKELQAFLAKYGEEPALEDVTATVAEIAENIHGQVEKYEEWKKPSSSQPGDSGNIYRNGRGGTSTAAGGGSVGPNPLEYGEGTVKAWIDQITEKLDASGTNDQLAMIHIKQLNDNINNSSGMVSGIIESRNNAASSIINNIA
jgi:hypothetical protein